MKTTALRLYGKMDIRMETFDLPEIGDDEILAEVICDSVCMSSFKAAKQGEDHSRVPADIADNPVIIGHEFTGRLLKVGKKWANKFKEGDGFGIQPALNYKGTLDAPGYSYQYIGGDATHIIIPNEVMEMDCLLAYEGDSWYKAGLAEPMSCNIGGAHANYHVKRGSYDHEMGIVEGGACALLAGAGPMGLGLTDYLINGPRKPKLLVVTDIDQARLDRAASIITPESAAEQGVKLVFLNTGEGDPIETLKSVNDGNEYNDIFVYAPVPAVIEQADKVLAEDGCLNFFAGPTDPEFSAKFNFFNVHYKGTHVVGTSGGNTDDLREALQLISEGKINPSMMITHIGGLPAGVETTKNLPSIPGGKKLLYTQLDLPLVAIADFAEEGKTNPLYAELDEVCKRHNGLWNPEAEKVILEKGPRLNA
ncbi:MAG: zinc-binding dehydrogenase [Planctomycetota bacterium]|jgi:threonine dehydrogenase-like Zn-dependent dehydrogenase